MKTVYTDIKTLSKVKRLINELGLKNVIDNPEAKSDINVMNLLDKLLDEGKFAEFMRTITKDEATDWESINMPEIKEYLDSFFGDIMTLFPAFVKNAVKLV